MLDEPENMTRGAEPGISVFMNSLHNFLSYAANTDTKKTALCFSHRIRNRLLIGTRNIYLVYANFTLAPLRVAPPVRLPI